MAETATGLVLRTRVLTETSLIVHWLTPDLGRLATVAKGARRANSPFRGKLDLFYLADFSFSRSRRSDLHTLREVGLKETHSYVRRDLAYLHQISYCVSLIEQTTETETPLGSVFQLVSGLLSALPRRPPHPATILAFELKLLAELGLLPDPARTDLTAGSQAILQRLIQWDWSGLEKLHLAPAQTVELRQFLHGFLIFHLGRLARGREAALLGPSS